MKINTNLSSIIVQNNLSKSTNALNQAIERMTTGYKLNHASDNAAGYSISENMSSQLSSYQVAQDNIAMGMDLLATAQDTISLMQQHGQRLMDLWTQAQNGTYGAQSLAAIQSEANARIAEINRLYANAEYNGINYLEGVELPDWAPTAQYNGFIADASADMDTPQVTVTDPARLLSAINTKTKIGIGNAETLAELAKIVNGTDGYIAKNCSGNTIILTDDIDLSAYSSGEGWTPIGTSSKQFKGIFNGNGHTITNLKIDREGSDYQGLFGCTYGAIIKNVVLKDVSIKGKDYVGGLVGYGNAINITNCTISGSVSGNNQVGGLVGSASGNITNSYSTGSVSGNDHVGGLAGGGTTITNSYSTGSVLGHDHVGGLVGSGNTITNSYSTGSVNGVHGAITYDSNGATEELEIKSTTLQVGINGDDSSQITFNAGLSVNISIADISSSSAYDTISNFLSSLSAKATELGAVSNRLEGALESTGVAIENLTSSRSTIKDADIAKESSAYIKSQILQQAAATLLATANQSPSIALQLL